MILGSEGVGKTAFAVRYITKRFIGEYDSNKEMLYTHKVIVDRSDVTLEILDSAHSMEATTLENHVKWADGYVCIYSVMDVASFQHVEELLRKLCTNKTEEGSTPVVVVANKADLTHGLAVSKEEGREMARRSHSAFYEISIAESSDGVQEVISELLRQIKRHFVASQMVSEKRSTLRGVKRVLKKKIYRSKSDTM